MKKIIIVGIILIATLQSYGQKVLGPLTVNAPTDSYGTHYDSLGVGGWMTVHTKAQRNAIPTLRRKAGMIVVTSDTIYQLLGGISDLNWVPVSFGNGAIGNLQQTLNLGNSAVNQTINLTGTFPYLFVSTAGVGSTGSVVSNMGVATEYFSIRNSALYDGATNLRGYRVTNGDNDQYLPAGRSGTLVFDINGQMADSTGHVALSVSANDSAVVEFISAPDSSYIIARHADGRRDTILTTGTSGGAGLRKVFSGAGLVNVNDSTLRTDTLQSSPYGMATLLATQKRIDSLIAVINAGYVPLSGTVAGKPVTGDIEIGSPTDIGKRRIFSLNSDVDGSNTSSIDFEEDGGVSMSKTYNSGENKNKLTVNDSYITIDNNDPVASGFRALQDFSANYDPLSYVQKIYSDKNLDTIYRSGDSLQVYKKNGTHWSIYSPTSTGGTSGTIRPVVITTANGISGTVDTSGANSNVTLSLGAITPTSVAASGTVTGSNLSGTNTGDETVTTIKSKLGITTLSGSNTGDQDLSGKLDKTDSTNTVTGYTSLYQNSLKLSTATAIANYHPLENQRLSTTNLPSFSGLTLNGVMVLNGLSGTPAAPAAGKQNLYADSTGSFTIQGSNGYPFSISKSHLTGPHRIYPQNKDYTAADSADLKAETDARIAADAGKQNILTPGTGISIVGSTISATGGGGAQTLQQTLTTGSMLTQANSINNGGFAQTSSNGKNIFDSISINAIANVRDSIVFDGTSITQGLNGISQPYFRFSSLVSQRLDAIEVNHGIQNSRMYVEGLNSSHLGAIPYYVAGKHRWMVLEWGTNDIRLNVVDTATYAAAYLRYLDTCIVRGWPTNKIIILSPSVLGSSAYAGFGARMSDFRICQAAIAARRSTRYIDIWSIASARGADKTLASDGLHPTDWGTSVVYVNPLIAFLGDAVKAKAQNLAIGGISEFKDVYVKSTDTLPVINSAVPALLDSTGKLVKGNQDLFIKNSVNSALQTADINNTGTATFSGKAEALHFVAKGTYSTSPTGSGVSVGYDGTSGIIDAYNWTTPAGLTLKLNGIGGGKVSVGGYGVTGAHSFGASGIQAGFLQVNGSSAPNTSSGIEMFNLTTTESYIGAYNTAGSPIRSLAFQHRGGMLYFGDQFAKGTNKSQFTGTIGTDNSISIGHYATPLARVDIHGGSTLAAPLKITTDTAATTAATGTGATVTLSIYDKGYIPFVAGSQIIVSGVTPSGYNGTYTVGASTRSSVSYTSTTTGVQTVAGTITSVPLTTTPKWGEFGQDANFVYWVDGSNTRRALNNASSISTGTATLVAGTVTVSTIAALTGSKIFITVNTPGGTQGFLSVPSASIVNGTSFVINSTSASETSTVNWWIPN